MRVLTNARVRAAIALAVAIGAFAGVREVSFVCLPPLVLGKLYWEGDRVARFLLLNAIFLVSVLWLLSELLHPFASRLSQNSTSRVVLALSSACAVYAVLSFALSLSVELPSFTSDDLSTRILFWFFADLPVLWHTGTFRPPSCGY